MAEATIKITMTELRDMIKTSFQEGWVARREAKVGDAKGETTFFTDAYAKFEPEFMKRFIS